MQTDSNAFNGTLKHKKKITGDYEENLIFREQQLRHALKRTSNSSK